MQPEDLANAGAAEAVTWGAYVDHAVTFFGIVIAALIIVWQMGRQHRNSLNLQQENKRAELRAGIYTKLLDRINLAEGAEVKTSSFVRMIPFSLKTFRTQLDLGINPSPVKERATELVRLDSELQTSGCHLIEIFESYEIALPGFDVFQDALNSVHHDLHKAFMPLYQETLRRLPLELVSDSSLDGARSSQTERPLHVPPPPSEQEFEELERLVEHYLDAVHRFGSYVHDLRVEAQNSLLSDLYPDQRAPRRTPLDPSQKVVTVEHADELKAFSETKHLGERTCRKPRRKLGARIGQPSQSSGFPPPQRAVKKNH